MTEHDKIHEELVTEYAHLQAEAAPILARMDEIKKYLRELPQGTHEIAGLTVVIAPNRRLDNKKFMEVYPADQYPDLYRVQPDSAAMKKYLSGVTVESLSTYGDPRVTIK